MRIRALWLGASALLIACLAYVWPFSVDDSYIVAQYARRIAAGLGYTFRSGPATDGVTGPLWLVPQLCAAWLGADAALASKVTGGLCALLTLLVLLWALAQRGLALRAMGFAALFVLTSVPFLTWAVAGLETSAACLAVLLLALAATARPRPHEGALSASAAALVWLRPELLPMTCVLLGWAWLRDRPRATRALCVLLASAVSNVIFRWWMFGHAWPMVSSAKPALLTHGATYVFASGGRLTNLLLLGLLIWPLRFASTREWALLGALLVHAATIVLAGGDWMPGMRLFAPTVAVLALALGPAFARWSLRQRGQALGACALLFGLRAHELAGELRAAHAGGLELAATAQELSRALRDVSGPVAALDVGALAYQIPNDVIDLGGLTEPHVAYARGGHLDKHIDPVWLESTAPARIVLHSSERPRVDTAGQVRWFAGYPVERRVLGMRWVLTGYRVERVIQHTSDYFYLVLAPRSAPISHMVSSGNELLGEVAHAANFRGLASAGVLAP